MKSRLFAVRKPHPFTTPKAPASLEAYASKANLQDGIRCPTCKHLYGDANGFHEPCEHLHAHYGPFGWELPPHQATECLQGNAAFRIIETMSIQGSDVTKVTSGELQDTDWLVWKKQTKSLSKVA